MRNIILVISMLWCSVSFAQAPAIEEVVEQFFSRYDNVMAPRILYFQKKKDGWYTVEVEYPQQDVLLHLQRFWTLDSGYAELDYPLRNDTAQAAIKETIDNYYNYYLQPYDREQFALHAYYGYAGWDWDVIRDFKDEPKLEDRQLESLARAYASYASGYFFDQYGYHFTNNDADRILLKDTTAISTSRKDKFIAYEWKAIGTFRRLQVQNPAYVTRVGRIDIKVANEHMFAASSLRFAGYDKDAEPFYNEARYPDSLVNKIQQMLGAVKPNGILFTSGDNDTYPTWQMQWKNKYRTDVAAINYSLLGLRRHLVYLQKGYKGSLFSTTAQTFMQPDFDYALFDDSKCKTPVPLDHLAQLINYNNTRRGFSCNELVKVISPTLAADMFKGKKMLGDMMIRLGNYLLMNDYMIFDIIEKQFYKRPIYFVVPDFIAGLKPYLRETGGVYWLAPVRE